MGLVHSLRPVPERAQFWCELTLQRIDDLFADEWEEFVCVAAATSCKEEVWVRWMVGDYEVAFGAVWA